MDEAEKVVEKPGRWLFSIDLVVMESPKDLTFAHDQPEPRRILALAQQGFQCRPACRRLRGVGHPSELRHHPADRPIGGSFDVFKGQGISDRPDGKAVSVGFGQKIRRSRIPGSGAGDALIHQGLVGADQQQRLEGAGGQASHGCSLVTTVIDATPWPDALKKA